MIVRQPSSQRTVLAPSYHLDLATDRLTIRVPHAALLDLVPATIRRATTEIESDRTLTIVIDCRGSPSLPGLSGIHLLAEALADSWDVSGPIALIADGIDVPVLTFSLGKLVSARAGNMIRVFADATHMETFLRHLPIAA